MLTMSPENWGSKKNYRIIKTEERQIVPEGSMPSFQYQPQRMGINDYIPMQTPTHVATVQKAYSYLISSSQLYCHYRQFSIPTTHKSKCGMIVVINSIRKFMYASVCSSYTLVLRFCKIVCLHMSTTIFPGSSHLNSYLVNRHNSIYFPLIK